MRLLTKKICNDISKVRGDGRLRQGKKKALQITLISCLVCKEWQIHSNSRKYLQNGTHPY